MVTSIAGLAAETDARLARKGLVVNARVTLATGTCEREASIEMVDEIPGQGQVTLGADKNYDGKDHVAQLRERK